MPCGCQNRLFFENMADVKAGRFTNLYNDSFVTHDRFVRKKSNRAFDRERFFDNFLRAEGVGDPERNR